MERYDAILEQLKKAQSRGLETVTNRLDFVVQSLEELIQEAKSTVQEAVPESVDEFLPVDEVKRVLDAYREEAEDLRSRAAALEAKLGDADHQAESAQTWGSIALIRALDGARSQSELLKELLPAISNHAARAVVLVLRDGKVSAWSGIGFTDGEALRNWQGEVAESAALVELLAANKPVRFTAAEDDLFNGWLTEKGTPGEILLIPVVLRGKLMGAVYIDHLEGQPWNPDAAQTLIALVCWLIDTLQFRAAAAPSLAVPVTISEAVEAVVEKTQADDEPQVGGPEEAEAGPEPAVAEAGDEIEIAESSSEAEVVDPSATMRIDVPAVDEIQPAPVEDGETAAQEEVEAVPGTEIAFQVEEETAPETEVADETDEPTIVGEGFEAEGPVEAGFEAPPEEKFEPVTVEEPSPEESREPVWAAEPAAPEPVAVPTAVQMPVAPPEPEERADEPESSAPKFLDEPPPVQPVQPPPDEPKEEVSEDEAQREEARRFARLLVSEIKLYNEEQVERGRESNDIYHRLREDIDRSREMFDKRISAEVRANQDYFTDELVRILADGNPDLLGM